MPNSGSLQFVKSSEVLSHIYILYILYRAHVHESASVSLPVREIGSRREIESSSLLSETGRELLECILASPQAVIEFEIYDFNRD